MVNLPPALQHRDFRLFWGGAVLSAMGSAFTTVALLVVLGVALVPSVRRFSLDDERKAAVT